MHAALQYMGITVSRYLNASSSTSLYGCTAGRHAGQADELFCDAMRGVVLLGSCCVWLSELRSADWLTLPLIDMLRALGVKGRQHA